MPSAALLLYPEALATSITLPAEILHAAGQLARARGAGASPVDVELFTLSQTESLTLDAGLTLAANGTLPKELNHDLLILPAIWRHPRRVLARCKPFLSRIADYHARGGTICSVGTASSLLAGAGLLDHCPATTHWHDFERFAAAYPRVDLKRRHLITQSGRLFCVGSVNSIADFMVHKVSDWYGDMVARAVEAQFSPEARQSFETAAFLQQSPGTHHDALVRDAQDRMQQEPGLAHSLTTLAEHADISPRSFSRRFRRATGETPMRYLQNLRIREARGLLQHSDLPIAEIADYLGFPSPSRFAQTFREATDFSPRHYRKAVRGKRFGDSQLTSEHTDSGGSVWSP